MKVEKVKENSQISGLVKSQYMKRNGKYCFVRPNVDELRRSTRHKNPGLHGLNFEKCGGQYLFVLKRILAIEWQIGDLLFKTYSFGSNWLKK